MLSPSAGLFSQGKRDQPPPGRRAENPHGRIRIPWTPWTNTDGPCVPRLPPHPDPPPPVGREKNSSPGQAHQMGGDAFPKGRLAGKPERGTFPAFPAGKACLRMLHSPDRTATTSGLVPSNQSVVSVHFDGIPPCPIRLRVPHPSSFPRESGIGRPVTAGRKSPWPNQGAVNAMDTMDKHGLTRTYTGVPVCQAGRHIRSKGTGHRWSIGISRKTVANPTRKGYNHPKPTI
jgi:hypothetical protein